MDEQYLELKNISKDFPGVRALDNVSISVNKGEIRALVGENGAGKSTLIKILSGAYQADSGEIILNGEKQVYHDAIQALALGIGAIYQEFYLIPHLSVSENIMMGRIPKKGISIDSPQMQKSAQEVIAKLGMNLDVSNKVQDLSVAQQQIVEIAKVISRDLSILIMDEPTAALNDIEISNLFKVIRNLRDHGVTILYISHRLKEIFDIADSVTVLKDGKVVDTRRINSVSRDELVRLMIGRKLDDYFPKKDTASNQVLLKAEDLWYGNQICGIDLEIYKGEILGLAGLEGQGQNELVRILAGAIKPDKGQIHLNGTPLVINSPYDAKSVGIGFIPDDRKRDGLVLVRSVNENMTLPSLDNRKRFGFFIDFISENSFVKELVNKLYIKILSPSQDVSMLSGGNQQKVVVGKWLGISPIVLIVAEPTRGIDVGSKKEIHFLMRDQARNGVGLFMSSRELPEILGMSDRILVISRGRIVAEFLSSEATEEKIMAAATKDIVNVNNFQVNKSE